MASAHDASHGLIPFYGQRMAVCRHNVHTVEVCRGLILSFGLVAKFHANWVLDTMTAL